MSRNLSVSVVIPTYNRAGLIGRALQSALHHCRDGDEIIVVDDGSTDNTADVVSQFPEPVRYVHIANSGAGAARNRGVAEASGDLIAFLDSDDEWMEHKLQWQREFMGAHPDVLFCFGNFAVQDRNGNTYRNFLANWHSDTRNWSQILGPPVPLLLAGPSSDAADSEQHFNVHIGNLFSSLAEHLYVFTSTLVVRRREAADALTFAANIPTYEDWACYGRLAARGKAAYFDHELAWQHGHAQARLTDADPRKTAQARIAVLQDVWGTNRDFLKQHGPLYRSLLDRQRKTLALELIIAGKTAAARGLLRQLQKAQLWLWMLSSVPHQMLQVALWLKKSRVRT